jgi:hypothetical protein
MDKDGKILAHGSNAAQAPFNSLAVGTYNSTAKAATTGMTAYMTYAYQPVGGGKAVHYNFRGQARIRTN